MKNIRAFPNLGDNSNDSEIYDGMTLLDYFAGQALTGYVANFESMNQINALSKKGEGRIVDITSKHCYSFAKAMLKEREKHHD